ncbi:putative Phage protein [Vibrio phage 275E43-1]|nr:putative Phage protein [Vibrio phage 275E43-1]
MSELIIGADPEFFVAEDGHILPAVDMVAGDKYNPLACLRGAMQVDGLALEFNIEPAKTAQEFNRNILTVKMLTLAKARATTGKKLRISRKIQHNFTASVFKELPEESKRLGCAASYTLQGGVSNIPRHHQTSPVRVVGGHIHLGWSENEDITRGSLHYRDCARLATVLDVLVQARLFMHLKENMNNTDYAQFISDEFTRKNRYGRWGEFRPKSYGMEYRSLSNFWIHSKELRTLVFEYTQEAYNWTINNPAMAQKMVTLCLVGELSYQMQLSTGQTRVEDNGIFKLIKKTLEV